MCLKYEYLICDQCGFELMYNIKSTWYFKCPVCGNVLVDVVLDESVLEDLDIVHYTSDEALKIF